MSDDVEKQQEESAADEPTGPVGGERLAEARRAQQISVHEVAKELHLDDPKVRALERNEFEVLGAPVFAKGHLKTYAQLVDIDVADVLADYYHLTRAETAPPVISTRPKPRKELSPGPWIAAIVVVVIIVSLYWWFSRPVETEAVIAVPEQAEDSVITTPPEGTDDDTPALPPESEDSAEAEPVVPATNTEPAAESEPEPQPEVDEGQLHLLVSYSGDCWTEITDASGRRLLFDLGKDGRTVEISGAEPFNVLFGNPGNVAIRVNGDDYALPPTNRPDRPMRLTISGS